MELSDILPFQSGLPPRLFKAWDRRGGRVAVRFDGAPRFGRTGGVSLSFFLFFSFFSLPLVLSSRACVKGGALTAPAAPAAVYRI